MKKERSQHAQVASLAKKFCKGMGIAVKASSDSYSGGSSVRVVMHDQPPAIYKAIRAELSKYEYGRFDGMRDIYEYTNSRDDIPQVRFLFVDNEISDTMRQKAWDFLKDTMAGYENAPIEYDPNWRTDREYASTEVYRLFTGAYSNLSERFWSTIG